MSDQEDFDQALTPSQEHSIAFVVILIFGAMYLFFMKGCQPIASSINEAFLTPPAVQMTNEKSRDRPLSNQKMAGDDRTQSNLDDVRENKAAALLAQQTVEEVAENPSSAQAIAASQILPGDNEFVQRDQASDVSKIKAEAASLAAAAEAQKRADKERFEAKQAALQAGKAALLIPAKPLETVSTSPQTTTSNAAQTSPSNTTPASQNATNTTATATTNQDRPFDLNAQLARVDFTLPDGRSIQIPKQGFESRFKQSILKGADGQPIVFDRVYFYPGSDLLNPESSNQILGVAGIMNTYKDISIKLRGHTDSTGQASNNLTLSFKRSLNLKKQLVGLGVDTNRIQVEGLGSSEPISDNGSEKGRNKNRRIDLTIIR